MNNVTIYISKLYTFLIIILFYFRISVHGKLSLFYPCYYSSIQYHNSLSLFQCDFCSCIIQSPSLLPPQQSSTNLCILLNNINSKKRELCMNKNDNSYFFENLLSKLNSIEYETRQQLLLYSSYLEQQYQWQDNEFELALALNNVELNRNTFHQLLTLFCSYNFTKITFYYLQYDTILNNKEKPQHFCHLSQTYSIRYINSFFNDYSVVLNHHHQQTVIFYNSTLNITSLNTTAHILSFYYVNFKRKTFSLSSLSSLIHLTISHSSLSSSFITLNGLFERLLYLDLCSNELTDDKLNHLIQTMEAPDLITLILSKNKLTILTNLFKHLSTIRYLDLSLNQIKMIDYFTFKDIYSLNSLNLSYNLNI
ncbi:unnamed protein product, partial [Didymodactylos carnosus]